MNIAECHYHAWITEIVKDITEAKCPQGIIEHIKKHAGPDLDKHLAEKVPDWARWSASMHNLLAIFDLMFLGGEPPVREKMYRLQEKYERNPDTHTPDPWLGKR